ncbi:MAG: hypothetical protein U0228_33850 [Myxococcaceae bacterium]
MIAVGGLALFSGCPDKAADAPIDAGTDAAGLDVDAGFDAGVIDAGPAVLEPTVTATLADGGTIEVKANSEIEPTRKLTIGLGVKLKDFRLRLMDWRDQLVVSDDEVSTDGRTLTISLPESLKAGRSYSLVLDAELGPVVTAESGASFNDWDLAFRIAGEVEPEPAAPGKKKPAGKKKK